MNWKFLKRIIVGLLLLVIAFPLIFWNEGRAVKRKKALNIGEGMVISVSNQKIDPENEGELVHVTGFATTNEILSDPVFLVQTNAIFLSRDVEMYQWVEIQRTVQKEDETETYFTYSKEWRSSLIDSSDFEREYTHENPDHMPYETKLFTAKNVQVGVFHLSSSLINSIEGFQPFILPDHTESPQVFDRKIHKEKNGYYLGNNPNEPRIGDLRVSFRRIVPQDVSIVAGQRKDTLIPYWVNEDSTLEELRMGTHSAEKIFQKARTENLIVTWASRIVGFFFMLFGFMQFLNIFSDAGNDVPILDDFIDVIEVGAFLSSALLGGIFFFITVTLAWLIYRPWLGGTLLAMAVILIVFKKKELKRTIQKRRLKQGHRM